MRDTVLGMVVAGVMCLALGCGQEAPSQAPAARRAAPAKKIAIGVSVPAADHGWTAGIGWWAERTMRMYPDVEWAYNTALTPEKQIADIKDMMAQQKLDGLVVLATESAPLTPIAEEAHKNGIYLVSVDRGFLKPVADLFIEGDNAAFGRKSAEFLVKKLGGKGNIVVLEGIPSTVNTARVEAAAEVFAQYPDIKILGQQTGMWNREKAHEVMKSFLVQFDNIDAVWASDDDMALGVEQALDEAGGNEHVWILGGAGMKDIIKRVMDKDPRYPADITYPPSMIAVGIHMCVSNLRDGKREQVSAFMPRHLVMDVEEVTPENASDYYFPESVY